MTPESPAPIAQRSMTAGPIDQVRRRTNKPHPRMAYGGFKVIVSK